jgi:hypothetical protein
MASKAPTSRKIPIRSKTKAQKRNATKDASSASAFVHVPTTGSDIGFRFRSKFAKKAFQDRFHDRTVIVERLVNLSNL